MSRARLRDVAAAAGVAESTVSRAFTGHAPISEETRQRILDAAKRLNYTPKRRSETEAESNRDRKGLVGVVVAALHNSFYPYLLDRVHNELDALGYDMILIIDDLSNSSSSRKIQSLIDTALDGVIFTTASIGSPAVDLFVERGIPTALAIRSNQRGNVDVIESDNKIAGAEATRHLIELGHRSIGFIHGPRETSTAVDRFTGAKRELEHFQLVAPETRSIWNSYTHQAGYSGLVQLMDTPNPPSAMVCGNDVIAIGALDACIKLGIRVPDQLSIIGFDDIPMAGWSMISLTTVRQSIGDIGALAARCISARIEGRADLAPAHHILPTSLIRRSTTGVPMKAPK